MARRVVIEQKYVTVITKSYDVWDFLRDFILVCFTGPFGLLWILIRELRR